ncbi:MAG: TonB-dependent receptor [Bacteroidales bacterium]|nr:TonB-dependent receptor [Bacteroidales bacterium]
MRKIISRLDFLVVFALLIFSVNQLYAQREVSGTVSEASTGDPLIGATIVVKGSSTGTVTDLNGAYSINVPGDDAVLQFSYVSYETKEVVVGNQTIIDVALVETATELEDVVVIGYGTVKKEDLTGAVAVVSSEDLNRTPIATFQKALQGKAPGVLVSQTSGRPGGGTSIRIRGIGSINGTDGPIYVVDGIRTGSLNQINPQDIESIQVLKDASSAAIYGNDGAGGVVIITTKRGQAGKTKVHYSSYYSMNKVPKKIELMNADQYADLFNEALDSIGVFEQAYTDEFRQQYYGEGWEQGTDWQDEITETGLAMNQYLRVSGGGENGNFSLSTNYWDEKGILLNNRATRYNVRLNSDFQVGKRIKIGQNLNITRYHSQSGAGNFNYTKTASPLLRVYNEDNKGGFAGSWDKMGFDANENDTIDANEYYNVAGRNDKYNPRGMALLSDNRSYSTNILGSIYAEVQIFDWLKFRTMPSVDLTQGRSNNWTPSYDMPPRTVPEATLNVNFYDNRSLRWENQLTFDRQIGDHHITATAVYDVNRFDSNNSGVESIGFDYEQLPVLSQGGSVSTSVTGGSGIFRSISYLGRVIYDYQGKYLLTASLRRDGNTRFAPGYRFGNFPALSVGWKINEDLFPQVSQIDMLKLRFGWGATGNSRIGSWKYDDFLSDTRVFAPVFGEPAYEAPGQYIYYSFANPLIQWESANMTNIGIDANLFRNKIQILAEYYIKNNNDMLVQRSISGVFGRSMDGSFPFVNVGQVRNKGLEFSGSWRETRGDFYYNITGTFTTIDNEVISLPSILSSGNNRSENGKPIGYLYGWVAERIITSDDFDDEGNYLYSEPTSGVPSPGDLKFSDLNNDGVIDDNDRTMIGHAMPNLIYSLTFDMEYSGIDFSFQFSGMHNYDIFNQERAQLSSFNFQDLDHNKLLDWAQNHYTVSNPSTEYVRADLNNENVNDRISTWWMEDGSFLRLRDVQLGYSLPDNLLTPLNMERLRLYVSVANGLIFTKYTGRDPENGAFSSSMGSGTDGGGYPNPRTFTFGIQVDF